MKLSITAKQYELIDKAQKEANIINMRVADILNSVLAGHEYPEGSSLVAIEEDGIVLEVPEENKKKK